LILKINLRKKSGCFNFWRGIFFSLGKPMCKIFIFCDVTEFKKDPETGSVCFCKDPFQMQN
jgi:hypothetical protein